MLEFKLKSAHMSQLNRSISEKLRRSCQIASTVQTLIRLFCTCLGHLKTPTSKNIYQQRGRGMVASKPSKQIVFKPLPSVFVLIDIDRLKD